MREADRLVSYGIAKGLLKKQDAAYARNRNMAVINSDGFESEPVLFEDLGSPQPILDDLLKIAFGTGALKSDTPVYRDMLGTELMAAITPRPSEVIGEFERLYEKSPRLATDWFYAFSTATNYIRADRVAKDIKWGYTSEYGDITVTVNLSKPEKDPAAIAAAKSERQTGYPKCAICRENEGFLGTASKAARGNHRVIPVTLGGEDWFLQYSPYVYYNEHCIALNGRHVPMVINRDTFKKLLDFVDLFPHYFMGSNADLPIVGGSILTHDHFQGGRFVFPMEKAEVEEIFEIGGFPGVSCGIVKWPMSVIRLSSFDREEILNLACHILESWHGYDDGEAQVLSFTDAPHNTVTPIARKKNGCGPYELDLVLRNNRTSAEHPLGIFHPHAEKHHIKKENIGLIEVMGLAVLPPRLKQAMADLKLCLLKKAALSDFPELEQHREWYEKLCKEYMFTEHNADDILKNAIGGIFVGCLEDAGVFKRDKKGKASFLRFAEAL